MKNCKVCNNELSGRQQSYCSKECTKTGRLEYQRQWRDKNPGKAAEYSHNWRKKHPEIYKASQTRQEAKPERHEQKKAANDRWRENNRQKHRDKNKKWRQDNPDKVQHMNRRREVRKQKAEGSHTYEEWINLREHYGNKCLSCGVSDSESKLYPDHITPLSKGGSDNIDNIQPLCGRCNSAKHTKETDYR